MQISTRTHRSWICRQLRRRREVQGTGQPAEELSIVRVVVRLSSTHRRVVVVYLGKEVMSVSKACRHKITRETNLSVIATCAEPSLCGNQFSPLNQHCVVKMRGSETRKRKTLSGHHLPHLLLLSPSTTELSLFQPINYQAQLLKYGVYNEVLYTDTQTDYPRLIP